MRYACMKTLLWVAAVGQFSLLVPGLMGEAHGQNVRANPPTAGPKATASDLNQNVQALSDAINNIATAIANAAACGSDLANDVMVKVGPLCVDKYEASVWSEKDGTGTQYGVASDDYPGGFPDNGNWTVPVYALSKPGVIPSRYITWPQAQQACALSGKRLLTNAEWQMAAAGTPDADASPDGTTTCNTNSAGPVPTGSTGPDATGCVSKWGARDMVGNASEWVADWSPPVAAACSSWGDLAPLSSLCWSGHPISFPEQDVPRALVRGGGHDPLRFESAQAGVFFIVALFSPAHSSDLIGFRCAR